LGIGDWGLGPIPNPQSPIPNPQSPYNNFINLILIKNILILKILLSISKLYIKNTSKKKLKKFCAIELKIYCLKN